MDGWSDVSKWMDGWRNGQTDGVREGGESYRVIYRITGNIITCDGCIVRPLVTKLIRIYKCNLVRVDARHPAYGERQFRKGV